MAYFNHAFRKMFPGTKGGAQGPDTKIFTEAYAGAQPGSLLSQAGINHGFITSQYVNFGGTIKIKSVDLQSYGMGPGTFAFFDKDTYEIVNTPSGCCPLVLAAASIRSNDKIGPFHGGYQESNKSKIINPKYIQEYYRVDPCIPQQAVLSIGTTPYTTTLTPADATCCKDFYCGETYYLRIDVKGSPTLRGLNHNAYRTLDAYTGCCPTDVPTVVDPTLVYITWAQQAITTEYLNHYILPVVFDYLQNPWYAPNSTVDPLSGIAVPTFMGTDGNTYPQTWDNYALSQQAVDWATDVLVTPSYSCSAGMRLLGAYVETKFGNCSFQITDFYEKEPVRIYASLVDYTGDPCVFEGLCVYHECDGYTGQGFGETVIRDLILSESYLQNFFHTDIRIREITEGTAVFNVVDRNALYTRYFLLHSVPRFNNPTGTFDNDRYLLEIVVAEDDPANPVGSTAFEAFMTSWMSNCADCDPYKVHECGPCTIIPNEP